MLKSKNITRESTIMFTDIVGYSKMVEKDETHAIKILNEHDQWNLFCKADDIRVHKNAETGAGEVRL